MKGSLSKVLFLSLIVVFAVMYFVVINEGKKIREEKRAELSSFQKKGEDSVENSPR